MRKNISADATIFVQNSLTIERVLLTGWAVGTHRKLAVQSQVAVAAGGCHAPQFRGHEFLYCLQLLIARPYLYSHSAANISFRTFDVIAAFIFVLFLTPFISQLN